MVDEARLRSTTDAQVWTEEFLTVVPDADPGLMLGWFANAIEAGALREVARYEPLSRADISRILDWFVRAHRNEPGSCGNENNDLVRRLEDLYRQVTEGGGS